MLLALKSGMVARAGSFRQILGHSENEVSPPNTERCGHEYNLSMGRILVHPALLTLLCVIASGTPANSQGSARPATSEFQDADSCPQAQELEAVTADSPQISVAEINFTGDLNLPISDREEIAASLKERKYHGDVSAELEERIRAAWQDRGYFKVSVSGDSTILTSSPIGARIAFTSHIVGGPQYRLGGITFEHNRAIINQQALRSLFPSNDGDIFSREKIAAELDRLREAYAQLGYVNFTAVPDAEINADDTLIHLHIDVDEGKQFYVSSVKILGVADPVRENLLQDIPLKVGQIYDARLVDLFWKRHPEFVPIDASASSATHLELDERKGTVAITLGARLCGFE